MTQPAPEKSEEVKVINDFLETLKMDGASPFVSTKQ